MKKKNLIICIIVVVYVAIVFGGICIVLTIASSQKNSEESYLCTTVSPDDEYTLQAYKVEPGATVDFSVKVYLIDGNDKLLIYNAYHEYDVNIIWIGDNIVSINEKVLDLSKGQTYDWRKNG